MARGRQVYLTFAAWVLLSGKPVVADLWSVNIDESPAPPPALGPPFSANASRDMSLLPYQIVGIVGSYLCVIFFIGTLLLTIGRRARKRALMLTQREKGTELVQSAGTTFDPSPVSPQSHRTWYPQRRMKGKESAVESVKSINSAISPAGESIASFDAAVVENDRLRRAEEMERLYAAVIGQDDEKSRRESANGAPPQYSRGEPLKLTATTHLQRLRTDFPQSPRSPVRVIYPPDHTPVAGNSAVSESSRLGHSRSPLSSIGSLSSLESAARENEARSSAGSSSKVLKKPRKSLKGIKISGPIMQHSHDGDDEARAPLSPRYYPDPGVPPEPPTGRTDGTMDSAYQSPVTARSFGYEDTIYPTPTMTLQPRDPPNPYPQRGPAEQLRISTNTTNFSQPLRPTSPPSKSAVSVNKVLPFRQYQDSATLSPYPSSNQGSHTADSIKTTFVEHRPDRLAVGAPRTGAKTPYSAYMPFTPLTPVTPHLASRAERKQRQRENRALQGAITEEDQVVNQSDMWDSGY